MTFPDVITFFGGLAVLLFGMHFLIEYLCRLTGSKLAVIIDEMASSPVKGLLWGTGITALVQSSGVVTVSLVGLVNAEILRLRQAISVIMGANIGTTLTAWLFALAGMESGNHLLTFFKAGTLGPVLAVAGFFFLLFAKSDRGRNIANVLFGFAVMFFGMDLMMHTISLLEADGAVSLFLHQFSHPSVYFAVGFLLTAFLQSSSTSVGFLQIIAVSGVVPVSSAVPAMMGMEIGACVMALISSFGTSGEAKQTAVAHLLFNSCGTVLFFIAYMLLSALMDPSLFSGSISMVGIAAAHTLFNLVTALVLLPLLPYFEYLVIRLAPVGKGERAEAVILEKRLLSSPSFAAKYSRGAMMEMMSLVYENLVDGLSLIHYYDDDVFHHLRETQSLVNEYERKLRRYLSELSCRELDVKDGNSLTSMLCSVVVLKQLSQQAAEMGRTSCEYRRRSSVGVTETNLFTLSDLVRDILQEVFCNAELSVGDQASLGKKIRDVRRVRGEGEAFCREQLRNGDFVAEDVMLYLSYTGHLECIAEYCGELSSYISRSDTDAAGYKTGKEETGFLP